jgi:hypothetical protein
VCEQALATHLGNGVVVRDNQLQVRRVALGGQRIEAANQRGSPVDDRDDHREIEVRGRRRFLHYITSRHRAGVGAVPNLRAARRWLFLTNTMTVTLPLCIH